MTAMTFAEWRDYKVKVMGQPPAWFDDHDECRRRYDDYRSAFDDNCTAVGTSEFLPVLAPMPITETLVASQAAVEPIFRPTFFSSLWGSIEQAFRMMDGVRYRRLAPALR